MRSKCGKNKEDGTRPFLSFKRYFSPLFILFFFILLVSFSEKSSNFFTCSKENNREKILQNCEPFVAMTHYALWKFLVGVGKNSFCLAFLHFSFLVNSSCLTSFESFTCFIRNNLKNLFKTARHVVRNKGNKFPVTSSMYLYSNRSWATTNHSTRSIHIIVWIRSIRVLRSI